MAYKALMHNRRVPVFHVTTNFHSVSQECCVYILCLRTATILLLRTTAAKVMQLRDVPALDAVCCMCIHTFISFQCGWYECIYKYRELYAILVVLMRHIIYGTFSVSLSVVRLSLRSAFTRLIFREIRQIRLGLLFAAHQGSELRCCFSFVFKVGNVILLNLKVRCALSKREQKIVIRITLQIYFEEEFHYTYC